MSRKDFELIAGVIRSLNVNEEQRLEIANQFARRLSSTNAGFKPSRFVEAAVNGKFG